MLVKDIRITGLHADIMKKYSRVRDPNDLVEHVQFLSYSEKKMNDEDLILFESYFNAFITSALIGMKNNKKVKMAQGTNKPATIFTEILAKNSSILRKVYHYYILIQSKTENINTAIKKAFSADVSAEEVNVFTVDILEYSCGGLEIIDSFFRDKHLIEDILISINEMIA
jgi:hypothetical protein